MNKVIPIVAVTAVILVLGFAANLISVDNQASAQQITPFPSREKVISVTGTATASVEPNLLVIQFGVETQEKTAREALESNSSLMNNVVDAIMMSGVSEDELSTSRLNIYPVYDSYRDSDGIYTQELIGYRVTNSVIVETENLGLGADIIDSAVSSGVNRVDSVSFTLTPEKQLEIKDDLLGKAVLDAKSKAEKALSPLNHQIIGVKSVSLSEFGMQPPIMYDGAYAMAESASFKSETPIFSSDQDVTTSASIVFLIGSN